VLEALQLQESSERLGLRRVSVCVCVCVCVCDYFFISCINLRDQDKAIMCVRGARLVDGGEGPAHDWPTLPIGHQSYL